MIVDVSVAGGSRTVEALVDTGASISLVRESLVDPADVDRSCREDIRGFGDRSFQTKGVVTLEIGLHGLVLSPSKFRVVADTALDYPVYLGENFFQDNRMKIDVGRKRLRVHDRSTGADWDLYLESGGAPSCHVLTSIPVVADQTVIVPPSTSVVVPVMVKSPWDTLSCPSCSESVPLLFFDGLVESARIKNFMEGEQGLLDPVHSSSLWVCVFNSGSKKRKVLEGDIIGRCSSVIEVSSAGVPSVCTVQALDSSVPVVQPSGEKPKVMSRTEIEEKVQLGDHLSPEQRTQIIEMIYDQREVLSTGDNDVGLALKGEYRIELTSNTPIYQRPRRFAKPTADAIEKQCVELNETGIIEPSKSPWSSPLVPIRKPDGTIRLCVDYRKLNQVTIADRFPMPNLLDSVYSLHGKRFFTSLDLVRGYYQMTIEPESREYTAFSTARGHWQFRRLSFGLKNAPSAFQRLMQQVLSEFSSEEVIIYIDDILIIGVDFLSHLHLVKRVLSVLRSHGIKLKSAKCQWFEEEVKFLGHVTGKDGMRKSSEYVQKVLDFPRPATVKELRSFLGLVNFQRKFIPHCSEIMKPLSSITGGRSSAKLKWTAVMEEAFARLKEAMAEDTHLVFPNFAEEADPLRLYVDASGIGAGAMLSQIQDGELRVIAFNSMTFSDTQRRYSTIERELTAIRWGIKSFRAFLYGNQFVLHTDHQPLVYLHNMKLVDSRLARTLEDLSDFDFVIEYTPGKDNLAADALSRAPSAVVPEQVATDCVGQLPDGLQVLKTVAGGGDAMLESLMLSLAQVAEHHEIPVPMELSLPELRDLLVSALLQNLDRYGLKGPQFPVKRLRLMKHPGQVMISEMFLVFADYFRVTVCVHYGGDKPVLFKTNLSTDIRVHVQCLAGIHFNPVKETRLYVHFVPLESELSDDIDLKECLEMEDSCTEDETSSLSSCDLLVTPALTCQHPQRNSAMLPVCWGKQVFCALFDTGSQVSLMKRSVAVTCQVSTDRPSVSCLQGLGAVPHSIVEAGNLNMILKTFQHTVEIVNFPFVITEDAILPYCMVFGSNLMAKYHLEIDYWSSCPRFQGQLISEAHIVSGGSTVAVAVESSLPLSVPPFDCSVLVSIVSDGGEATVLSEELLLQDQMDCAQVRRLKRKLSEGSDGKDLPALLRPFRRVWRYLCLKDNLVVKKFHDSYVTVVSFNFLVAFVLNTHVDMAHIGTFKLLKLVGSHVWHPSLTRIVRDACRSCSVCQMGKAASNLVLPPTIKVKTAFPFDLMAADLLSLPNSMQGFIGCLVVVDHYSKWLAVVPIKNKQCSTVVNALRDRIFPGLLRLPCRLLTDNGPEFTGVAMEEFLDDLNIYHVRTTPYMPSCNGAVERVNRTVIGVLNKLGTAQDWVSQLPRAVLIYNNTVHRELSMSPAQFLLKKCHASVDQPIVSPLTREYWKEGHHRFTSFKVNDVVLKKVNRIGNRTVDKFEPKYAGPYCIKEVHTNRVSYDLCDLDDPDQITKAHHVQLKPWIEPPKYIIEFMARSPIYGSVSEEGIVDDSEACYRPSRLVGNALDQASSSVSSESSSSSVSRVSSGSSLSSVSSSSSDSSDSPRTGIRRSRVRFQVDGSVRDSSMSSSFSGFSPKPILKPSRALADGDDPRDDLLGNVVSPLAGSGLVASSFLEEVAPSVSWDVSPIANAPVGLQDSLLPVPVDPVVSSHVTSTITMYADSPLASADLAWRPRKVSPASAARFLDLSVLDDLHLLFEGASAELEDYFDRVSRTMAFERSRPGRSLETARRVVLPVCG